MKTATCIFIFVIAAGASLLFLVNMNVQKEIVASEPVFICGNVAPPNLTEELKQGERLFKANCAACHKLDSQSTGPRLRGIAIQYEEKRSTSLDSFFYMRRFRRELNTDTSCFISPEITDEDIQNILLYTQ